MRNPGFVGTAVSRVGQRRSKSDVSARRETSQVDATVADGNQPTPSPCLFPFAFANPKPKTGWCRQLVWDAVRKA